LDISEIRITLRDDNKLKGFASITLENAFVIRGLKIIEGASGLFIAMPSRKRKGSRTVRFRRRRDTGTSTTTMIIR